MGLRSGLLRVCVRAGVGRLYCNVEYVGGNLPSHVRTLCLCLTASPHGGVYLLKAKQILECSAVRVQVSAYCQDGNLATSSSGEQLVAVLHRSLLATLTRRLCAVLSLVGKEYVHVL